MEFTVEKFHIRLHRLSQTGDSENNRLVLYVDKMCELGKKYLNEKDLVDTKLSSD